MPSKLAAIKAKKLASISTTAPGTPLSSLSAPGAAPAATATGKSADAAANVMLARLTTDRAQLKSIQSLTRKIQAKREMLPEYDNWIAGLLEASGDLPEGKSNDILTTIMMWRIDCGHIESALDIAEVVLERKIPMPAWFDRKVPTVVAEEVAQAALDAIRVTDDFDLDLITRVQLLTEEHDMPDEVRAKMYKAAAQLLERGLDDLQLQSDNADDSVAGKYPATIDEALIAAEKAVRLDEKSGVKTLISKLKKRKTEFEASRAEPAGE